MNKYLGTFDTCLRLCNTAQKQKHLVVLFIGCFQVHVAKCLDRVD